MDHLVEKLLSCFTVTGTVVSVDDKESLAHHSFSTACSSSALLHLNQNSSLETPSRSRHAAQAPVLVQINSGPLCVLFQPQQLLFSPRPSSG